MGVAMASNVGGMTSPLSSPQDVFAIALLAQNGTPPSWLSWFAVSLPVATACNFGIWYLLLLVYKPALAQAEVTPLRAPSDKITSTQVRWCPSRRSHSAACGRRAGSDVRHCLTF